MDGNFGSMTPAKLLRQPTDVRYHSKGRLWQGIPTIERTKTGKFYAAWYSGLRGEEPGNYVVVETSEDGEHWTDAFLVVEHDDPKVRCFDACLWIDPQDRLWLTWTQSWGSNYDGRHGVWAAICEDPDAGIPVFSEPRRIANGLMLNKPLVCRDGTWLFPCALWPTRYLDAEHGDAHPELAEELGANVYATTDEGKTFQRRGMAVVEERVFDEHHVVELADGRLWMLTRTRYGLGQAFSSDGGYTWEQVGPSGHTGPNSRCCLRRLRSGKLLLVNHLNPTYVTAPKEWNVRNNLTAMLSEDDGQTWQGLLVLDARSDVSYPDATEDEDGRIYVIYDRERYKAREILLATFTEADVLSGEIVTSGSSLRQVINTASGVAE